MASTRYIVMSVPMNENEGAYWFVYDTRTNHSQEVADYRAACIRVRELNTR